jgi:uncharacterized membrane protein YdjX (TVP38/TMEM64 family)
MPTTSTSDRPTRPARLARRLTWRRAGGVLLAVAVLLAVIWLSATGHVGQARDRMQHVLGAFLRWTSQLGMWGPIVLGLIYIAATVAMLPGLILTMGAGAVFGLGVGVVTVSISSTLGATAAFVIGRTVARGWVADKLAARPAFKAIDDAVGQQGLRVVLLTRLSPVFPFNLLNYAFGLTGVPLGKYVLGSWAGMIPGTIMYVYIGSVIGDLSRVAAGLEQREKTTAEWVLYGVGLAATVAVTVLITRTARRALRRTVPADREPALDSAAHAEPTP